MKKKKTAEPVSISRAQREPRGTEETMEIMEIAGQGKESLDWQERGYV